MTAQLYEALKLSQDASPDDVRKAYRKMALQTHPDRLPPDASEEDKSRANEKFRIINNAYEVLSDPQKRQEYDRHGVWPPPQPSPTFEPGYERRGHRSHSRRQSADQYGFPGPSYQRGPVFTDPFDLFNSLFGDFQSLFTEMNRPYNDPFSDPFFADPFPGFGGRTRHPMLGGSMFSNMMRAPVGFGPAFPALIDGGNVRSTSFSTRGVFNGGGSGRWVSESRMTRTINGVTESVWQRKDSDGNDHVTYSYPDGRERYLINGVEQPSREGGDRRHIDYRDIREHQREPQRSQTMPLPPPPPYPGPPQQPMQPVQPIPTPRREHSSHHGSHHSHSHSARLKPHHHHRDRDYEKEQQYYDRERHHDRKEKHMRPVSPSSDGHSRRRWW